MPLTTQAPPAAPTEVLWAARARHEANLARAADLADTDLRAHFASLADSLLTLDPSRSESVDLLVLQAASAANAEAQELEYPRGVIGVLADALGSARINAPERDALLSSHMAATRAAVSAPDRYRASLAALTRAGAHHVVTNSTVVTATAAALRTGDPLATVLLAHVELAPLLAVDPNVLASLAHVVGLPVGLLASLAAIPGLQAQDAIAAATEAAR